MIRLFLCCLFVSSLQAETLTYRIGKGTLQETPEGVILRLEGTHYEMGVQHGRLLREKIQENVTRFLESEDFAENPRVQAFKNEMSKIVRFIPPCYLDEMRGLAVGADIPFEKILLLNLFPEMFHCIGIAAQNGATLDHSLYHVRVLDYRAGLGLQSTAALMVFKPLEKNAFVSVGYAGFIGCVTGMNEEKIAMGEIGGDGYGKWEGVPMAFLMREILEKSDNLNEAKEYLVNAPRSCEYYYVISDGKEEKMVGAYATGHQIQFIEAGESYAIIPSHDEELDHFKETAVIPSISTALSDFQLRVDDVSGHPIALLNHQPEHCLILKGGGYPERYPVIAQRLKDAFGTINEEMLKQIIKPPATGETNLHNVIFHPSTLEFWVSHAGEDGSPASEQPYASFNLNELLYPEY